MGRELWFEAPRAARLRDAAPLVAGPGEIVARAIASGISRGTELLLYRGEGPTPFDPSMGAATYPCRYGYAWVGEVTSAGDGAGLGIGQRIFALAPHGDEHRADARSVRAIPDGIPATRATLAANLETGVNAAWDARVGLGDRALVVGGGVVGLACALAAARSGADVTVVEPAGHRRDAALAIGAARAVATDGELDGRFDVVFEVTGRPESLTSAIERAADEARVVIASFYGARIAPVPLGDAFHRRRLSLVSSQVSRIPPERAARWDHARRFELVLALLQDARLDAMIDPPRPFERAAEVYAELDARPAEGLHATFAYGR